MENYHEAFSPLSTEHLDIATLDHLTEENTDHPEASDSNLICSQDSYMGDINQGNILHSHIELDSPKIQYPKSNPQYNLPYSVLHPSQYQLVLILPGIVLNFRLKSVPVQFQATHNSIRFLILLIP